MRERERERESFLFYFLFFLPNNYLDDIQFDYRLRFDPTKIKIINIH